ncbi:MAG: hypothetical protein DRG78_06800 [Epsilonproteobacteria bacterium]|nr:MAG: hypothetical protein DRG78_06800 [Campylobacterota bacterium]
MNKILFLISFCLINLIAKDIDIKLLNTDHQYVQKVKVCFKDFYLYEEPKQNSSRILIGDAMGGNIDINGCNKYGWCKTHKGYIKRYILVGSCNHKLKENKQSNIDNKIDEKLYGTFIKIEQPKLKKIPQIISNNLPIKHKVIEKQIQIKEKIPKKVIIKTKKKQIKKQKDVRKKFISFSFGIPNASNSSGKYGYTLEVGKYLESVIFTTFNISNYIYNDFDIFSYGFSLNHQYEGEFKPYLGFEIGVANLVWTKSPVSNTVSSYSTSTSGFYGIRAGMKYDIDERLEYILSGKYLKSNFNTKVQTQTSSRLINTSNIMNINIGLKYKF